MLMIDIIVQGKFAHIVREFMQRALDIVVKWAVKEGLNISPHKTTVLDAYRFLIQEITQYFHSAYLLIFQQIYKISRDRLW